MTPEKKPSRPDFETTDASPRLAALLGGGMILIVALGFAVAAGVYPWKRQPDQAVRSGFKDGAWALNSISIDWEKEDQAVEDHLKGYAWVDPKKGIVRIPIDRAIDLIIAERSSPPASRAPVPAVP